MDRFENVSVVKAANIFFDGKVTSRTVIFPGGEKKTLGVMQPGEYTFGTAEKEVMEIYSGRLDVQLPGSDAWVAISSGQSFEVPPQSKFHLKVHELTDYCCSFIA